jgi:hypothetical protein
MFKKLYKTALFIIFNPGEAWNSLSDNKTELSKGFLSNYIYPFIGLVASVAFISILFTRREFNLEIAIKSSLLSLLSMSGGFFLASYIVSECWVSIFKRERSFQLCQMFVGYSFSLIFSLNIILNLLPDFFFLRLLVLYTIYIVWEGAVPFMNVKADEQLKFVGIVTASIILSPSLIEFVLGMLMPGFRF